MNCAAYGEPEAVSLRELTRDARGATLELQHGRLLRGEGALRNGARVRARLRLLVRPAGAGAAGAAGPRGRGGGEEGAPGLGGGGRPAGLRGPAPLGGGSGARWRCRGDGTRACRVGGPSPRRGSRGDTCRSSWRGSRGRCSRATTKSAVVEISRRALRRLPPAAGAGPSGCSCGWCSRGARRRRPGSGRIGRRRAAPPVGGARDAGSALHQPRRGSTRSAFEALFPGAPAGVVRLRRCGLQRQGVPVAFHVEPDAGASGRAACSTSTPTTRCPRPPSRRRWPGSWCVPRRGGGWTWRRRAPSGPARRLGVGRLAAFETNRFYQPGLLEAPDPWLWERVAVRGRAGEALLARGRGRRRRRSRRSSWCLLQGGFRRGRHPAGPPRERLAERVRRGRDATSTAERPTG